MHKMLYIDLVLAARRLVFGSMLQVLRTHFAFVLQ